MRVAILGSTADQLASSLKQRGHEVAVYAGTMPHMFRAALHCARRVRPDVALCFGAGTSPLCLVFRGGGIPAVIYLDRTEPQGSWSTRIYLRFAGRNASRWADAVVPRDAAPAEYERLLESVIAMAGPGWLPAELVDGSDASPASPRAAR